MYTYLIAVGAYILHLLNHPIRFEFKLRYICHAGYLVSRVSATSECKMSVPFTLIIPMRSLAYVVAIGPTQKMLILCNQCMPTTTSKALIMTWLDMFRVYLFR